MSNFNFIVLYTALKNIKCKKIITLDLDSPAAIRHIVRNKKYRSGLSRVRRCHPV